MRKRKEVGRGDKEGESGHDQGIMYACMELSQ
jgi:hypothetical protein